MNHHEIYLFLLSDKTVNLLFKGASQHYSQLVTGCLKDGINNSNAASSAINSVRLAEERERLKSVRLLGCGQFVPVNPVNEVKYALTLTLFFVVQFTLLIFDISLIRLIKILKCKYCYFQFILAQSNAQQSGPTLRLLHSEVSPARSLHQLRPTAVRTLWL